MRVLGLAERAERRPEVVAPVGTRHREGAGRVQRPAGVPDPLVGGPVGRHQPSRLVRVVRRREPDQVERVAQAVRRQPQQRTPDRLAKDGGDGDLPEWPQVGRGQLGQLAGHHRLDRSVADEGGQPRMREPPPARWRAAPAPARPADPGSPGRARCSAGPGAGRRPGRPAAHRRPAGSPESSFTTSRRERPAAGRGGQRRALHRLEPGLAGQPPLVAQQRRQVVIGQQEPADLPGRRDERERRPDDDRHLSEPGPHRVEQARIAGRRAADLLTPADDHPQLQDVVAHRALPPGPAADAADRQGAADRQVEVVGKHRRDAPAPGRVAVSTSRQVAPASTTTWSSWRS